MVDFTSALYLGLRHASHRLRPWDQLTAGVPAAFREPAAARTAAAGLARLTGREAGVLARSTLHAFFDLLPLLARGNVAVWMDQATYPVARWGVERAASRGTRAGTFAHHQPDHLWHLARDGDRRGRCPLVVADGVCSGCGRPAPVAAYLEIADRLGGRLVLDDTQALGLLGPEGGGSLRRAGDGGPAVLVASLAKAFGAPLAFVGGPSVDVATIEAEGETRTHLSPPTFADVHAALRALEVNAAEGTARRARLGQVVDRFRRGLLALGLSGVGAPGLLLPVQPVPQVPKLPAEELHRRLLAAGIRAILHRSCRGRPQVSFIFTAAHQPSQVDRALEALAAAIGAPARPGPRKAAFATRRRSSGAKSGSSASTRSRGGVPSSSPPRSASRGSRTMPSTAHRGIRMRRSTRRLPAARSAPRSRPG